MACDIGAVLRLAEPRLTPSSRTRRTRRGALASRLRLLRSHGMTALTWDRHRGDTHSYDVVEHGFNYRLDEIRAAMGLVQLRRLREVSAHAPPAPVDGSLRSLAQLSIDANVREAALPHRVLGTDA